MNDATRWLSSKLRSLKRAAVEAEVVEACSRQSFFSWKRAAIE
uniref:Uncharacterized protein n=1 Tax=Cucumis melo TaxID=3656 RepID=A0A9I9E276_CUCME